MIKKIIYIHETFYREHRDMGINLFEEKGYEVELWSTLKIKYKNKLEIPKDNTKHKVIYFSNHIQLIKEIFKQNWKYTIVFFTTTTHRGGIEDFLRIVIGIAGGRYCNFIYEIPPVGLFTKNKKNNLNEKVKDIYNKYKQNFYQFIIKSFFHPTFCFVPTYQAVKYLVTSWEKEVMIEVHNKDYDEYLILGDEEKKDNYIIFIDSDMANAEDFRKNNINAIYQQNFIYFENINKLFLKLEEYYKIPVYIAAHPKSEYKGNEFKGRRIFYYQTCKLIQNAKLVLTHSSVAVNFIMLYKKPYIFLIDKYIKKHMIWNYLTFPQIKELRIMPYDIGQDNEPLKYINYPNKSYDMYIEKYIKHTNFNKKLFYEIVEETIRKI